ncbi:hypothetical protein [Terriglobus aquaticus]|uniref:Uncharacterized protein n=1 Tax=Terriglobus aquaticus TaxID=940139 RepID=A0ABW9KF58_9BACT|nr:hypothetical protein [Terriglobus aquaticus]
MTALVAGFLLVGYLLAPGAIYRFVFSQVLPSKRIQRTRTEEILFSVLAVILPFAVAFAVSRTAIGSFPHLHIGGSKSAAYEAVLEALLSSPPVPNVVPAFQRAFYEQARFLLYLWPLCAFEAWLVGRLVRHYGDFPERSFARWLCDRFLLKQVSEWHVLFSRMSLPTDDPRTVVVVDALTSQNLIYRGSLVNWFLEQDGKLAGIFLEDAERFNRDDLKRDREAGVERDH